MARARSLWPFLVLLVVSFIPFAGPLSRGEALGPWDQIRSMVPGGGEAADRPWDVLQADGALQFYVWRDLMARKIESGEGMGWNRYALLGTPFAANGQSGTEYPLHQLLGRGIPTATIVTVLAWFHLFWTGLGIFALARLLGALRWTAALSSLAVVGSTWLLSWTVLASVPTTVSWIPWVLVAIFWKPSGSRGLLLVAWGLRVLAPLMLVAGGHLQFIAYGAIAALIGLAVAMTRRELRWGALVCFGVFATGAFFQTMPTRELAKTSHRANVASEEGFQAYLRGAYPLQYWTGLLLPASLGNPQSWLEIDQQRVGGFRPALTHPGSNLAEIGFGLGPILLALCFGVRKLRREELPVVWLGGGLALAGLLLALPTPLLRLLYFGVPGWSASGSPARAGVLVLIGATVLLAVMCRPHLVAPTKPMGALIALVLTFFILALLSPVEPTTVVIPLVAFAVMAGLLAFGAAGRVTGAVALVIAAASMLVSNAHVPSGSIPQLAFLPSESQGRVAVVNRNWNLFQTPKALLPPNLFTLAGVRDTGGYESLMDAATVNRLKAANSGENPSPPENGNMIFMKSPDLAALADLGVSQLITREGIQTVAAKPYAEINGQAVDVTWLQGDQVRLSPNQTGRIVFRERNLPGWKLVAGSGELLRDTFWIEVQSSSTSPITLKYETPGASAWPVLSGLRWLALSTILAGAILLGLRPRNGEKVAEA